MELSLQSPRDSGIFFFLNFKLFHIPPTKFQRPSNHIVRFITATTEPIFCDIHFCCHHGKWPGKGDVRFEVLPLAHSLKVPVCYGQEVIMVVAWDSQSPHIRDKNQREMNFICPAHFSPFLFTLGSQLMGWYYSHSVKPPLQLNLSGNMS